jgi:hypothetical protein
MGKEKRGIGFDSASELLRRLLYSFAIRSRRQALRQKRVRAALGAILRPCRIGLGLI